MSTENRKYGALHPMAGKCFQQGKEVFKFNNVGETLLVASCTSLESAEAACRLLKDGLRD